MERTAKSNYSPYHGSHKKKMMVVVDRSGSGDGSCEEDSAADDSNEEGVPSPNIRRAFTKLQERRLLTPGGGTSVINGPASQLKDGGTSKKHSTT